MHLLADFFDWYSSAFIGIPDAFVDGREGLFILLIQDRSRIFKIEFLGLSHMPNSIPNRLGMQLLGYEFGSDMVFRSGDRG